MHDLLPLGDAPIDRAFSAGARADRLGYAFAGGYAEALRALVPGLEGVAALCVTEAGGNRPRHIQTKLEAGQLSGHKKWATGASLASSLLVAASTGVDDAGRNHIKLVRVRTDAPGVTMKAMNAPFVPEIPHAEVTFDRVAVGEADILPGDGYEQYVKPFRTVEDLHVHAALLGYLIGVARRHDWRELVERLLALAVTTRALAVADRDAAGTHLALAGLFDLVAPQVAALEALWAQAPDEEWQRWQRDRVLLSVAGSARAARREKAWARVMLPKDSPNANGPF